MGRKTRDGTLHVHRCKADVGWEPKESSVGEKSSPTVAARHMLKVVAAVLAGCRVH